MTALTFITYVKAKLNRLDTSAYEDVLPEEIALRDDVRVLEHGQVSVGRTLGETRSIGQQLHDRLRIRGAGQRIDDAATALGVALAVIAKSLQRRVVNHRIRGN